MVTDAGKKENAKVNATFHMFHADIPSKEKKSEMTEKIEKEQKNGPTGIEDIGDL